MESILTVALLVLLAGVGWVVATVLRGGAPTGESSARADINASAGGHGTEQMDSIRSKQGR